MLIDNLRTNLKEKCENIVNDETTINSNLDSSSTAKFPKSMVKLSLEIAKLTEKFAKTPYDAQLQAEYENLLEHTKGIAKNKKQKSWEKIEKDGPYQGHTPLLFLLLSLGVIKSSPMSYKFLDEPEILNSLIELASTAAMQAPETWGKGCNGKTPVSVLIQLVINNKSDAQLYRLAETMFSHAKKNVWANLLNNDEYFKEICAAFKDFNNDTNSSGYKQFICRLMECATDDVLCTIAESNGFNSFLMSALAALKEKPNDPHVLSFAVSAAKCASKDCWGKEMTNGPYKRETPLSILLEMYVKKAISCTGNKYAAELFSKAYCYAQTDAWQHLAKAEDLFVLLMTAFKDNPDDQILVHFLEKTTSFSTSLISKSSPKAEENTLASIAVMSLKRIMDRANSDSSNKKISNKALIGFIYNLVSTLAATDWEKVDKQGFIPLHVLIELAIKNYEDEAIAKLTLKLLNNSSKMLAKLPQETVLQMIEAVTNNPKNIALMTIAQKVVIHVSQENLEKVETENEGIKRFTPLMSIMRTLLFKIKKLDNDDEKHSIITHLTALVYEVAQSAPKAWGQMAKDIDVKLNTPLRILLQLCLTNPGDKALDRLVELACNQAPPNAWTQLFAEAQLVSLMNSFQENPNSTAMLLFAKKATIHAVSNWSQKTAVQSKSKDTPLSMLVKMFAAQPNNKPLAKLMLKVAEQVDPQAWVEMFAASENHRLLSSLVKIVQQNLIENPLDDALVDFVAKIAKHAPAQAWTTVDTKDNSSPLSNLAQLFIQKPDDVTINPLLEVASTCKKDPDQQQNQLLKNETLLVSLMRVLEKKLESKGKINSERLINFIAKVAEHLSQEAWVHKDEQNNTPLSILLQLVIKKPRHKFLDPLIDVVPKKGLFKEWNELFKDDSLLANLMDLVRENPENSSVIGLAKNAVVYARKAAWVDKDQWGIFDAPLMTLTFTLYTNHVTHCGSAELLDLTRSAINFAPKEAFKHIESEGPFEGDTVYRRLFAAFSKDPYNDTVFNIIKQAINEASSDDLSQEHKTKQAIKEVSSDDLSKKRKKNEKHTFETPFLIFTKIFVQNPTHKDIAFLAGILAMKVARIDAWHNLYKSNDFQFLTFAKEILENKGKILDGNAQTFIQKLIAHAPNKISNEGDMQAGMHLAKNEINSDATNELIDEVDAPPIVERKFEQNVKNGSQSLTSLLGNYLKKPPIAPEMEDLRKSVLCSDSVSYKEYEQLYGENEYLLDINSQVNVLAQIFDENADEKTIVDLAQLLVDNACNEDGIKLISQLANKVCGQAWKEFFTVLKDFTAKAVLNKSKHIPARQFIAEMANRGKSFSDELERKKLQKTLLELYCPNRQSDDRNYFHSSLFRLFGAYSKSEKVHAGELFNTSGGKTVKPAAKQGLLGKITGLYQYR